MNDPADKLFEARLSDLTFRAERSGAGVFSHFLDERQCVIAEQWCSRNCGGLRYLLWGGFPEARRKMLAVYPVYCQDYIMEGFPMVCLSFSYRNEDSLTHRDFLGSFMGARLKRETIGDIITGEGLTQAFVTDVAAKDLSSAVTKIGRVGVKVSTDLPFQMDTSQEFKEISGTVASLRLDAVLSGLLNAGRAAAEGLIADGRVCVNSFAVQKATKKVTAGDVITVRGAGKFKIISAGGATRKGRERVLAEKYL